MLDEFVFVGDLGFEAAGLVALGEALESAVEGGFGDSFLAEFLFDHAQALGFAADLILDVESGIFVVVEIFSCDEKFDD